MAASIIAAPAIASPPASAIRYTYDGLGQLKSVTDPSSLTAVFGWDPVGNLLSIGNQPASALSLAQVAPTSGAVGASVTLYGTGFDPTPANDAVSFNGTPATVTAASSAQMTVTVPDGATSGPISVTTPAGSVMSDAAFAVVGGPRITGLSAAVVAPGSTLTVNGSGFDTTLAENTALLNQTRVDLSTATATALSMLVPATGSGPVSVNTPFGQATGPDVFIAPSGHPATDVVSTGRMNVGDTRTVSIPTAGKLGMVLFDGVKGQQLAIRTSSSTFSSLPQLSVLRPDGSTMVGPRAYTFTDQFTLSDTGTYTILVDAANVGSGSVAVQLIGTADVTTSVTPSASGGSATLSTTLPAQNMVFTFSGSQGQGIAVKEQDGGTYHYLNLRKPDTGTLAGASGMLGPSAGTYFIDKTVLPVSGKYSVYIDVDPISSAATMGSTTVTVYDVPADVTGTLSPSAAGSAASVSTTPGQNASYTFAGSAGQRISLRTTNSTYPRNPNLSIVKPDGSTLVGPTATSYLDAVTLPTSGTYKIVVDPQTYDAGGLTLTAYDASDATASITPTSSGGSATLSTSVPGQNMAFTFSGTQGQRVAVKDQYPSGWHYLYLRKPDGTNVWSTGQLGSGAGTYFGDTATLPVTGTYTVYVDVNPSLATTMGATTVTVYDVPADLTGSLSPSAAGSAASVSTTPGQNASYTFAGSAGQRVSFRTTNSTYPRNPNLSIVKPDGSTLVGPTAPSYLDAMTLPTSGTYKIVVDPQSSDAGSLTLTAYDASDATASITPTSAGGSATLSTSVPGQNMAFTFSGTQGQVIAVNDVFPNAYHYLSIRKPDGGNLWGPSLMFAGWGSYFVDKVTLPTTGTYTVYLDVDPGAPTTMSSTTVTVYSVPPDVSGSMPIGGTPVSLTTTPAQNASFAFVAPANKTIHLAFSSVTETSQWTIKNPSGGNLSSGTINNGQTATVAATLTTAGTYTVGIDPQGPAAGGMTLTLTDPPGFTRPVVTDTTLPTVFRQPPFIPVGPESERFRCTRASEPDGGHGRTAHRGCARAASTRVVFRAPSDVWRWLQPGAGSDIAIHQPGQKAEVAFNGVVGQRVELRLERASAPTYLFVLNALGRDPISPRRIPTGSRTIPLSLPNSGRYTVVIVPRDGRAARIRVRVAGRAKRRAGRSQHVHRTAARRTHRAGAARGAHAGARPMPTVRFRSRALAAWIPDARNLHGNWRTGRGQSPWTKLVSLRAPAEVTGLAGQALRLDGTPLAGVLLSIRGTTASMRTDATGRFLLQNVSAGHHVLVVDGTAVHRRHEHYGYFKIGVDLKAGETTTLGFPIWMTQLDPEGDTRIQDPTKHEVVLSTPRIPGLEVRIPAGSTIRDHAGHLLHSLNVTQVPVDRPPFPLPPTVEVPLYFTVQPGGAYLSKGAQIIYPNYTHLPPGRRVDFWNYDAESRGWYIYGRGTVSQNGKQVVPDADVRVWEFTGAMISSTQSPPSAGPVPGGGPEGGDPVDLGTGLFVYRKTDLVVGDSAIPIKIQRTYRPRDNNSYSFGIGTTSKYDIRLWSVTNYTSADLILPDGGRVHYLRTSSGTGWADAVYEAQNAPGEFYRSTLSWSSANDWDLRLQDGTIYKFGTYAPLQAIIDRFGNKLTITRTNGENGNITKITTPHGRSVRFTYDASNRITQAIDSAGRTVTYSYDAGGRLATVTDPVGNQTSMTYDGSGNMTAIHDARGHDYVTNVYDSNSNVVQQTMADGATYHFEYGLNIYLTAHDRTIVTEPNGTKDIHYFSDTGYETAMRRDYGGPNEEYTVFSRPDANNLMSYSVDPLGNKTTYQYDGFGRPTAITRSADTPNAATTHISYDAAYGQPTAITDPLGHTTSFTYDAKGRLTETQDATGRRTTYAYDNGDGLPTSITDPLGKITRLSYFGGDLVAITDPLGNRTSRYYDAAGRMVAVTDPVGNRTRFEYNGNNQLTKVSDPAGHDTSFTYDPDGNLLQVQDPRADTTTMTYDPLGRVLTRTDGLNRTASFAYDLDGNLIRTTSKGGVTSAFQYDSLDRPTFAGYGAADAQGNAPFQNTVSYAYDLDDELLSAQDSSAGTFSYGYDGLGRVTSASGPDGSVAYGYDAGNRLVSSAVNGTTTTYGYDNANRLTSATQGTLTASIGYDGDGRRSSVTLPNGIGKSYTWDDASRLTDLQYAQGATSVGDLHYAYDADGHRLAEWGSLARTSIPAPMASATYDAANEQTSRNGQTMLYDGDGNLTSDGTTTYAWDAQGRLASTAGPGLNVSYAYDPLGRRIGKTVNGQTTRYVYSGSNVAQEISGSLTTANILNGLRMDDRFSRTDAGGTSSYLNDALGSVLALTDSTGATTTSYTYGPFGQTSSSGASSTNPYQYAARENDGNGLSYNRARYYRPGSSRFASEDPIGMAGSGTNLYRYVKNDPLDYTDPMGLSWNPVDWAGSALDWTSGRIHQDLMLIAPSTGYYSLGYSEFKLFGIHLGLDLNCHGHLGLTAGAGFGYGDSWSFTHHTGNFHPGQVEMFAAGTGGSGSGEVAMDVGGASGDSVGDASGALGVGSGLSYDAGFETTIGPKDGPC